MEQKLHTGRLEGIMTTEVPLFHGAGTKRGKGKDTIDECIKMKFFAEGGAGDPVFVPIYQGNAFRGNMRDIGATLISNHIQSFDSLTSFRLYFHGGSSRTTEAGGIKPGDIAAEREFRKNNPTLSMFGFQMRSIIAGHLRVGHAIPITQATKHLVPDYFEQQEGITPHKNDVTDIAMLTRIDDSSDITKDTYMTDAALLELDAELRHIAETKKKATTKANGGATVEAGEEAENKKSVQMIRHFEVIAAGVNLFHSIDFFNSTEEEIGFVVAILQAFAMQPFVGARSASGLGKVALKYNLIMEDNKLQGKALSLNTQMGFQLNNAFLQGCLDKFNAWLAGVDRAVVEGTALFGEAKESAA